MTIKTFDAFSKLTFSGTNSITNFVYNFSGEFRDTKSAIRKSILYAAKEIPGLGGYVFVMEHEQEIVGVVILNRTGMNEYLSENILVYLAVKDEFRDKNVAEKLIQYTKQYCKGDIAIHIHKNNPNIKIFKKEGFEPRNIEMRLVR
ncbi:GNAT family N-acetyltransferase [Polaribacter cellanae]|uniref:GNAT family N-acetyltransferase n=1 Tax=Polaribacter cellanae TaxID=2818493 RepID=A0A975CKQ0_9FLAO|nr:GNAT family N-acetyltransferase [Polaribacter cellanae]QTE21681.1 GNAT family N-acetyltransferase [Polaribacter cellanae]